MPEALAVDWDAIEKGWCAGLSYRQLSETFGVEEPALRQRAKRYSWPKIGLGRVVTTLSQEAQNGQKVSTNLAVEQAVNASLEQIAARHPLRMASFLEKKLSRAIERDTLPEIDNWKAANTAESMLRRSLGLDRPQVAVQINAWGGNVGAMWSDEGADSGQTLDADVE